VLAKEAGIAWQTGVRGTFSFSGLTAPVVISGSIDGFIAQVLMPRPSAADIV
jgi:hypothetical protein